MSEEVFFDWLGNPLAVGDWVVYSSTSSNTGMNLARIEAIGYSQKRITTRMLTLRVVNTSSYSWSIGRRISLLAGTGAFKSVTKYSGQVKVKEAS